jgi:hypothetical protein
MSANRLMKIVTKQTWRKTCLHDSGPIETVAVYTTLYQTNILSEDQKYVNKE